MAKVYNTTLFHNDVVGLPFTQNVTGPIDSLAGASILYAKTDGNLYLLQPDGSTTQVSGGSGGTPGGSPGQIQYNNAGTFGGTGITYTVSGSGPTLTFQSNLSSQGNITGDNDTTIIISGGPYTVSNPGGVILNGSPATTNGVSAGGVSINGGSVAGFTGSNGGSANLAAGGVDSGDSNPFGVNINGGSISSNISNSTSTAGGDVVINGGAAQAFSANNTVGNGGNVVIKGGLTQQGGGGGLASGNGGNVILAGGVVGGSGTPGNVQVQGNAVIGTMGSNTLGFFGGTGTTQQLIVFPSAAPTLTGTYATDVANLQACLNNLVSVIDTLLTKLEAYNLVTD